MTAPTGGEPISAADGTPESEGDDHDEWVKIETCHAEFRVLRVYGVYGFRGFRV